MRLNLRLDDSAGELFERLALRLKIKPRELILDALAIYNHAARKIENGGHLGVMDKNGKFTQIITPSLDALVADYEKAHPDSNIEVEETDVVIAAPAEKTVSQGKKKRNAEPA